MDDLRSTLEAAVTSSTPEPAAPAPVSTPSPVPEAPAAAPPQPATPVDTSGEGGSQPVKSDSPSASNGALPDKTIEEVVNEPADQKPADQKPAADGRIDRAPASWKGEAKKLWTELPLSARQEVVRREREVNKVLQESAVDRQKVSAIQNVLQPHMERIGQMYQGNPLTAINNLLGVEKVLVSGTQADKVKLVADMISHFKIDIASLDSALAGQPLPPEQQQLASVEQLLDQRLQPVMTFLQRQQQLEQQSAQQIEQQAANTVEQMMADTNKYPYMADVREDMADLIELAAKKGLYLSLDEAYNKAVRMSDSASQATSVREHSQAATQAALSAHQEAQRAKGAAVSVSGSPSGTGGNIGNPKDLRGTIASALESMGGRV